MDRDRLRPVVIALLVVVVIGVAAATIANPVENSGGAGGLGGGPGGLGGEDQSDEDRGLSPSNDSNPQMGLPFARPCVGFLTSDAFLTGALVVAALGTYLLYRRTDALATFGVTVALALPTLLLYFILTAGCSGPSNRADLGGTPFPTPDPGDGFLPSGGGGIGGEGTGAIPPSTLLVFVVLFVGVLVVLGLLFFGSPGEDETGGTATAAVEDDVDVAAIGQVAGEAADRIEDAADVENEVYRAWAEMTEHVAVAHPESSTPGEFAAAAVDAGMAREDVDELTRLFETVRYGGEAATDERERRAVAALRRIETQYTEDDGGGDGGDGPSRDPGGGRGVSS